MKQKHLTSDERVTIEKLLDMNCSFKWIRGETGKDCTTISKEVRTNSVTKNIGTYGRGFNNCINRYQCDYENSVCPSVYPYIIEYNFNCFFLFLLSHLDA